MADNFLKYTGLNYSDIYAQISDRINADPRFENFKESAIAQTIIEIFTGTTDLSNYYIQRRAEECYFDTAQLKSSIISLSRQLGYVISRSEPAKLKMKIIMKGDYKDVFVYGVDNKIQIPYYSKFTLDGNDFVMVDTMTFNITSSMISAIDVASANGVDFELEITKDSFGNDILLAQGEIKEKVIIGNNNSQVGANFQVYKIEDKEFSDIFGDKDYFHNPVTKIYVGNQKAEDTEYSIDRRSLINWESLESNDLVEASKVCVVRTSLDEYVDILFGDGGFAAKGPLTRQDNIYIQYLATKGKAANKIGLLDNKINYSGVVYTNTGIDITDKIEFKALSNITGGSDLEDADSIKYSAPQIYYSLDRLVTKADYIAYLKSLKSPIAVKNAIAWGEQEERDKNGVFADVKMFNVGFFSIIGSLYNTDGAIYGPKTKTNGLDEIVLDLDYDPDEISIQSYFNIYTQQKQANQLKQYDVISYYSKITGNELDTSATVPSYYASKYTNNAVLTFTYGSDIVDNASNITTSGSITVDLSTSTTMDEIASALNDELVTVIDERANSFDNLNYLNVAFTSVTDEDLIVWNKDESQFEVSFGTDTKTNINSFSGELSDSIGLTGKTLFSVGVTQREDISGKIIEVVDNLNSRGQMNINSIYISPIIHNFNITGTVYVKPLYDKESLKTEINNSIYEWLNLNADFNEPIRMSNIIELIEKNSGIVNTNIELVPEDITSGWNNKTNKYYLGYDDNLLWPYGVDASYVFGRELVNYLGHDNTQPNMDDMENAWGENALSATGNDKNSFVPINRERKFINKFHINPKNKTYAIEVHKTLVDENYSINNYINERTFFNDFVKNLFGEVLVKANTQLQPINPDDYGNKTYLAIDEHNNEIEVTNYKKMIGQSSPIQSYGTPTTYSMVNVDSDFIKLIGKIHKDLSYIIKLNMIDSNGNIEREYNSNGKYVRGGYNLGSEIPKISLSHLTYEYK